MRIAILANVPVWTLPGLDHLKHDNHYSTWLEPLVPAFAAHKDLEIYWITMCKETDRDLTHRAHGQTFHILRRGSKAIQMATGYLRETLRIRKVIREIQPDIVHAWGSEDAYGIAGSFSGVESRIFTLQGCLTEYLRLIGGSFLFRLQTLYELPTVKRYRYATAESPGAKEILKKLNPALNISLVEYGIGPSFFKAEWNPAEKPEIIFIGSIVRRKGIEDLIAAAADPKLAHINFKIAGSGELRGALEAISTPNVEWLGQCDRNEVIRRLESAWALVMPTYSDTGPTVLKEARVIGLPVITTTGAGASSYLENGKNGYIVEPGDRAALVNAIGKLCVSRDHVITAGQHRWEEQRIQLHPKATADNFCSLYRRIAS